MTKAEALDAITVTMHAAGTPAHYGPIAPVVAELAAARLEKRARAKLAEPPRPRKPRQPRIVVLPAPAPDAIWRRWAR